MQLFLGTVNFTIESAPVGLLLLEDGEIILKSQYLNNNKPLCTIVQNGENYCGDYLLKCIVILIM